MLQFLSGRQFSYRRCPLPLTIDPVFYFLPQFPSLINGHMPVPLPNLEGTPSPLLLSPTTHKSWSADERERGEKKIFVPHQQICRPASQFVTSLPFFSVFLLFYFFALAPDCSGWKHLGKAIRRRVCETSVWTYSTFPHWPCPPWTAVARRQLQKPGRPLVLPRAWLILILFLNVHRRETVWYRMSVCTTLLKIVLAVPLSSLFFNSSFQIFYVKTSFQINEKNLCIDFKCFFCTGLGIQFIFYMGFFVLWRMFCHFQ